MHSLSRYIRIISNIPASTTGGKPIVLSNSDGRILFAASYGGDLYKLDIKEKDNLEILTSNGMK